jgi:hypothetical protein
VHGASASSINVLADGMTRCKGAPPPWWCASAQRCPVPLQTYICHPSRLPACLLAGGAVMARVLNTAVPRFLQQLSEDYATWAAGDDSRQPVADGGLLDDASNGAATPGH